MTRKERQIDSMWKKLGFEIDDSKADVKANLVIGKRLILRSYRSHGRGKLEGKVPNWIRGQMKLSASQFADAVNCPLDRTAYLKILREKGLLPEED